MPAQYVASPLALDRRNWRRAVAMAVRTVRETDLSLQLPARERNVEPARCDDARPVRRAGPIEPKPEERKMLGWAVTFLIIALIAAVLGFGGIASASAGIAQIIFVVFLVLLVASLIMHASRGRRF